MNKNRRGDAGAHTQNKNLNPNCTGHGGFGWSTEFSKTTGRARALYVIRAYPWTQGYNHTDNTRRKFVGDCDRGNVSGKLGRESQARNVAGECNQKHYYVDYDQGGTNSPQR